MLPEDVRPADSSAAVAPETPDSAQDVGSAPGDVTPVQPGDDRPVTNAVAEFNRKFAKLQAQYDTLMQYVASQTPVRATSPPSKGEPTDDELFSLMQQGDKGALDLYIDRRASRSGQAQTQQYEQRRLVENQLSILVGRYPVLNDVSHPLTQQATSTYQALLARGYVAGSATLLEAIKTAIADRPDLVSELHAKSQPASLRRERTQAGVIGATVREEPGTPSTKPVSKAEAQLAQRIGVKDPAKSKERFQHRQNIGLSSVSDTLHPFLREE